MFQNQAPLLPGETIQTTGKCLSVIPASCLYLELTCVHVDMVRTGQVQPFTPGIRQREKSGIATLMAKWQLQWDGIISSSGPYYSREKQGKQLSRQSENVAKDALAHTLQKECFQVWPMFQ